MNTKKLEQIVNKALTQPDIRSAYYKAGDGVMALWAIRSQLGQKSQARIAELRRSLDALLDALNEEHPKWD